MENQLHKKKVPKHRLNSLRDLRRFAARSINEFNRNLIDEKKLRALFYAISIYTTILKETTIEQQLIQLEGEIDELKKTNNTA